MAGTLFTDGSESSFQAANYLRQQMFYLEKTMQQMDEQTFDAAIGEILSARRIWSRQKRISLHGTAPVLPPAAAGPASFAATIRRNRDDGGTGPGRRKRLGHLLRILQSILGRTGHPRLPEDLRLPDPLLHRPSPRPKRRTG